MTQPLPRENEPAEIVADPEIGGPDSTLDDAPPPILGSWRNVYLMLLVALAAQVGLYWLLGRWAS